MIAYWNQVLGIHHQAKKVQSDSHEDYIWSECGGNDIQIKACNLKISSTKVKNQDKGIESDDWGGWRLQIY